MRALFKLIKWTVLLAPVVALALAWFALSDTPVIAEPAQLSHKDVARARNIIKENDPRGVPEGAVRSIRVSEKDANLFANHLLQRFDGAAKLTIEQGRVHVVATAKVPKLPVRPYVNLELDVVADGRAVDVRGLKVGSVPVPDVLAAWLAPYAFDAFAGAGRVKLAGSVVREWTLSPGYADLRYVWSNDLLDAARATVAAQLDVDALAAYHNALASLQGEGIGRRGELTPLLTRMFAVAADRSRTTDPVVEHRAMLAVLAAWATGRGMDKLVAPDRQTGRPKPFALKLDKRLDFGQHFLTSAALVAAGSDTVSDAIGLYKEVADSKHGSGFSFTDLAADRVGTRFGQLATGSRDSAVALQKAFAAGMSESDYFPHASDLPQGMTAEQFAQQYGEIGSPAYREVEREIEQRISSCKLYRG